MPHDSAGQAGGSPEWLGIASEEVRFARLDETLARIRNLRERFHNSLSAERLILCEDYLEGRLEIVVELEISAGIDRAIDQCSEIEPVTVRLEISSPKRKSLLANRDTKPINCHLRDRWNDQFVFIQDVEIVEGPQGVLPAVVGLQLFDHSQRIGRGPLHLTLHALSTGLREPISGCYESVPIYARREVSVARISGADGRGGEDDRYVVESRPQIVDNVANDPGKFHRHVAMANEYDLRLPRFLIGPKNEIAALSVGEVAGGVLSLKKVSLGPFEL